MNKDYIIDKLYQFKILIEKVNHKKLFKEWLEYKREKIQGDRVLIESEKFNFIESRYNIRFPDYIKFFYSNIGCKESDFHYQINRMFNAENQTLLDYQYTEEFATVIVQEYLKKTIDEKEIIHEEIKSVDKDGALMSYDSDLKYLLWEGLAFFNKDKNVFTIPFLQKTYFDLNSDPDLVIENFFTWCHCGGAGGIVLNTSRSGYNAGEQWGDGLTITCNGKEYDYKSNFHLSRSDFHLTEFIDEIESETIYLERFLQDN